MLHFSRGKVLGILAICLFGLLASLPNFVSNETLKKFPGFMPHSRINLGLDLQGGAHVLAAMDTDDLKKDWILKLRDQVRDVFIKKQLPRYAAIGNAPNGLLVRLSKPEEQAAAFEALRALAQPVASSAAAGGTALDLDIKREGADAILIVPTEQGVIGRIGMAMGSAVEIVRNRADPGGNKEIVVQLQGRDRLLIQVPGIENTDIIKEWTNIAKLSFHLLHPTATVEEARQRLPAGHMVTEGRTPGEAYVLEQRAIVTGEDLVDAQQQYEQNGVSPVVSFRFNQKGARAFGTATSQNVGRPFAVVLDNKVITAPVIQTPILGGSGQISGNFTVESATSLATNLRSGALPAKLTIVEERVVGASLGADSIKAGQRASMIGFGFVIAFMTFAYGLFGLFAIFAVALNVLLIVAVMSLLGSTLTLPGIAGIVLTVGMAVDANVLIYERMREELRAGKSTIAALDSGFDRALATIVDSNLTTLVAGIVMFWLGSGPIRGFAITLSLGILTTVFTAFTVTRLLVAWWLKTQTGNKAVAKIAPPLSFNAART
jgi:protein-export membrane protein SecD